MRRMAILAGLAALALLLAPGSGARADEWDTATDTDNGPSTDNGLLHGSAQVHDLAFGRLSTRTGTGWRAIPGPPTKR